ncbi:MAG: translocation/assembly module TamB domain-containing protein [Bacteroidota bacterium]
MRKFTKITFIVIGCIILLLLGGFLFLNTESGQNFVRGRAEAYLRNKLKTEVHIGKLSYSLPKYIVLNNALFLDQKRDTLLAVGTMKVDLDMMKLLKSKVEVQQIIISDLRSHIYRNAPDTNYNFTYIINAFTGPATAKATPADTSAPLTFRLDRLKLDNIHLRFDDETGGMRLMTDLRHLDLRMQEMDVETMTFKIKSLAVNGVRATFDQDTSYLAPATTVDTSKMKLVAENVDLQQVVFTYNNNLNKFLFDLNLGSLQLKLNEFNRTSNNVDISKLAINNSSAVLKVGKSTTPPAPIDSIVKIDTTEGWYVNAKEIDLGGINFKMDDENKPKLKHGLDYSHLDIKDLGMSLRGLSYNSDTVLGDLKQFTVKEQSGLNVQELRTVFNYSSNGVILQDLYLQTPDTRLQNYAEVSYPSLETLSKNIGAMQVNVNLENSYVGLKDLALFMPSLRQQPVFRKLSNSRIRVDAKVKGYVNNLDIAKLHVSGLTNTELAISGRVRGLPEPRNLNYNVHISSFRSSRQDLTAILPPGTLSSIRVPDRFGIVGQLAGTMSSYNGAIVFASTDGYANVKGQLAMGRKGAERYNVVGSIRQLNLGRILMQDDIKGPVTASFDVKGQGFDPKTMSAAGKVDIASATVKGYRYHDVLVKGSVVKQKVVADIQSFDKNARLTISAKADLAPKYPAIVADIKIDSIDLQALNLSKTELRARGTIHADIPVLNPDYPEGKFVWYQPVIVADGTRYFMDSVYAVSKPTADRSQNIFVNLDVLQATVTGHTPLTKVGAIVAEHINRHYYALPVNDTAGTAGAKYTITVKPRKEKTIKTKPADVPANYDLQFKAVVLDKPLLRGLVPGLTSFDSIHLDGSLTPRDLAFNAKVPELVYTSYTVKNADAQLRGTDSALTYAVTADQVSNLSLGVWYAKVNGRIDNNFITTDISLSDSLKRERFAVRANMTSVGPAQVIRVDTGLKLNYDVWQVAQPNQIVLDNRGVYVQNFSISHEGQSLTANSTQQQPNSPMRIDIFNFQLANVSEIISRSDTLLATGLLNGNVMIERMSPTMQMTGDLTVQELALYGDTLGNVHALANNKTDNAIDAKVTLTGHGNNIVATGMYYLKPQNGNTLDLNVALSPLAVKSIEGLVSHQIRKTSGYLRGELKLQGTLTDPHITGKLKTDNLRTTVAYLGTEYLMPSETIDFYQYQMVLRDFKLLDSAGNKATINGSIATVEWTNLDFNLAVKANNWQALNSTAKDNDMFFGDLFLTTDLKIKGTSTDPSVEGNVHVLKNTKFTVINPQQNSEASSSKGIVMFQNMRDTSAYLVPKPDTLVAKRRFSAGSGINVGITVDKEAEFSMIIDQASGDFVSIHGEANLITAIRPGGAMDVTGTFTIYSGVYQFNYNFIKRKFQIQSGSSISFGGDPLTSTVLNITAVYEARVSPYDLVMRQVPDPAELNFYRQGLPFNVTAHMEGNLQQPSFRFDVVLPENRVYPLSADKIDLVQAKLAQMRADTSETNKQVFAILILNRFVSDDPFSSGATTSLASTAAQSISTFIGEQLNQVAGKLIKGVDLSVDLATTDDYTTGDLRRRTDLNVAASKRLMNDRLKVTIGNAFELEGPQTAGNNQSSLVPSNIAADYLLTGDGRYTLRAYRRNYDAGVFQGFIAETGLNFIISADYNRLKTVFMRRKPRRQQVTQATPDTTKQNTRLN